MRAEVKGTLMELDPPAWPVCSACGMAYVLRRAVVVGSGPEWIWQWIWQRDCIKPAVCRRRGGTGLVQVKA
jgi:hypothetical protein